MHSFQSMSREKWAESKPLICFKISISLSWVLLQYSSSNEQHFLPFGPLLLSSSYHPQFDFQLELAYPLYHSMGADSSSTFIHLNVNGSTDEKGLFWS
jgi:hypothetical protein